MKKLREADAMLNAGQDPAVVLQKLEISDATYHRWRNQYGGMKASEAKRLLELEDEYPAKLLFPCDRLFVCTRVFRSFASPSSFA